VGDNPREVELAWAFIRSGAVTVLPISDRDLPDIEMLMRRNVVNWLHSWKWAQFSPHRVGHVRGWGPPGQGRSTQWRLLCLGAGGLAKDGFR
jgi:hypothetical protein